MARKKSKTWLESYPNLIIGAVIIIILGVLVGSYFANRNQQAKEAEQIAQQQESQEAAADEYKVTAGDSLSKISEKYYGTFDYWPMLSRVNNIKNPNVIAVDTTLKIPKKAEADKINEEMTQSSYQVQEGDTLFIIAQKMYGDGYKWTTIDKANKVGRLANGNPLIFTGSTLTIPR